MHSRSEGRRTPWGALAGLAGGMMLVYLFDPDRERLSRALGRERVKSAIQKPSSPGLEGIGGELRRDVLSLREEHWSPRARVAAGALGSVLAALGTRRRGLLGLGLSTAGLGLLVRSTTNYPMMRLVGVHRARIAIHKTLEIAAPVEDVYRYWDVERFPRFMDRVQEVRRLGGGRYHWKLQGPFGFPIEWDAVVTRHDPNRLVVWATEPGATVSHVGMVRFERLSENMTRVSVHVSYDPPAGCLGHALARLFAVDPRSELDRHLASFQKLVENTPWLLRERLDS